MVVQCACVEWPGVGMILALGKILSETAFAMARRVFDGVAGVGDASLLLVRFDIIVMVDGLRLRKGKLLNVVLLVEFDKE
jgi:hypothetical protein